MQCQRQWVCVGVLRGEGMGGSQITGGASALPLLPMTTARYYKLGYITNPNQVPWH